MPNSRDRLNKLIITRKMKKFTRKMKKFTRKMKILQ